MFNFTFNLGSVYGAWLSACSRSRKVLFLMLFLHEQLGSVYYVSNSIFTGKPGIFHNNSKNFQNTIIKIASKILMYEIRSELDGN